MTQDIMQWVWIIALFIALSMKFYRIDTTLDELKDRIKKLEDK